MMKDNGSVMAESAPPPFKLEREVTLMPSEFRERLSASHRSSRKSSAARSANAKKTGMRSTKPQIPQSPNINQLNAFSEELNNGVDLAYHHMQTHYEPSSEYNGRSDKDDYRKGTMERGHYHEDRREGGLYGESGREGGLYGGGETEGAAIELEEEVKFMLDNAYTNYEAGNGYSIKTPPSNMSIKDIMVPLEDWGSKDTIREKKYAVLPSIKSPNSDKSFATRLSHTSDLSFNNQLDFGRDRMEQEADFFADFRVNTSKVRPTPRQDPLPPIHVPGSTPELSPRLHRRSNTKSKLRGRSKDRQKMIL